MSEQNYPYGHYDPTLAAANQQANDAEQRKAAEAALGSALDQTFTDHAERVTTAPDGSETLRLYTPWRSSAGHALTKSQPLILLAPKTKLATPRLR